MKGRSNYADIQQGFVRIYSIQHFLVELVSTYFKSPSHSSMLHCSIPCTLLDTTPAMVIIYDPSPIFVFSQLSVIVLCWSQPYLSILVWELKIIVLSRLSSAWRVDNQWRLLFDRCSLGIGKYQRQHDCDSAPGK